MRLAEPEPQGIAEKVLQADADEDQDRESESDFNHNDPTVALLPSYVATGHKSAGN
jgi:hypothetical protein